MNFPANPEIGQVHTAENTTWRYYNDGWGRETINAPNNDTDYRPGKSVSPLIDVDIDGLQHGDVLRYDSSKDTWFAA